MNYYEILGIKENATEEEIKEAYKKQIKKWHPDLNKDPEAINISMKINEAKDVLLDENKRRDYDYSLKEEKDRIYNKYSNNKSETTNDNKDINEYTEAYDETYTENKKEDKGLTKWEYLNEYLKYYNVNGFRKIIAVFFVLLESLICTILKFLIIGLALLCFYISDFIMMVYYYLYPIIVAYLILVVTIWVFKGNSYMFKNNMELITSSGIIIGTFLSSFLLIIAGNLLLSRKVFDFLYNKLDITLFKWSVGYKH